MPPQSRPPGTPIDILTAALKKEREAYSFYDQLINRSTVAVIRELLELLRDEEHKHVVMIEKKISKLRGIR